MTEAQLRATFPNASDDFIERNLKAFRREVEEIEAANLDGTVHQIDGPTRLAVAPTIKQMLMHGSEADFQAWVIGVAEAAGWKWRHITHSTISLADGRRVGDHDARDIPDLMLWRGDRFMWRELKKTSGTLTDGQLAFLSDMRAAGIDADVWWPKDVEHIIAYLA
jgi:hypothetical protein